MKLLQAILLSAIFMGLSRAIFDNEFQDYPTCMNGKSQSPIDIDSGAAVYDAEKAKVQFNWQRVDAKVTLESSNDGETAFFEAETFKENTVLGTSKFIISLINFHWPETGGKGSEHAIDGNKFDGEIEFIHVKDGFTDLEKAFEEEGNAIGVSVFLKEDASLEKDIKLINDYKSTLASIVEAGSSIKVSLTEKTLSVSSLIPEGGKFFRYTGSNTVTGCVEGMERIVFKEPISVTADFFAKLRTLKRKDGKGVLLSSFNRDLQATNGRTVYKSFE